MLRAVAAPLRRLATPASAPVRAAPPALLRHASSKAADRYSLIDCRRVVAKPDLFGGVGAYATQPIKKGELVERGVVRTVPVDGNECEYVFTWSDDRSVWATGSGCSVYYNAALDGKPNTEMKRAYDGDQFEIYALRDIDVDEEVTHVYKSLEWRDCFKGLKALRDSGEVLTKPGKPAGPPVLDCSNVYAKLDQYGGVGAFAARPIAKGEIVEFGIVRRLPVDGHKSWILFTWSEDRTVWAGTSGLAAFYNTALDGSENTKMHRYFDEDRFEIVALRDIDEDEELTHVYRSLDWRQAFKDLKATRDDLRAAGAA